MNVTREVIMDLVPLYLAGEASSPSRALVEEYLAQDVELAQRIRLQWVESLAKMAPSVLPPELELRSLRRTRSLLGWQRWLFGFALAFTALPLSSTFTFEGDRLTDFHFLLRDHPVLLGAGPGLALACWIAYFVIRRRLRTRVS